MLRVPRFPRDPQVALERAIISMRLRFRVLDWEWARAMEHAYSQQSLQNLRLLPNYNRSYYLNHLGSNVFQFSCRDVRTALPDTPPTSPNKKVEDTSNLFRPQALHQELAQVITNATQLRWCPMVPPSPWPPSRFAPQRRRGAWQLSAAAPLQNPATVIKSCHGNDVEVWRCGNPSPTSPCYILLYPVIIFIMGAWSPWF